MAEATKTLSHIPLPAISLKVVRFPAEFRTLPNPQARQHKANSAMSEAGTLVTTSWFLRMIQRSGRAAKLPFPIHPHMLRHSTGYKLANQGEDTRSLAHYLGHRKSTIDGQIYCACT
jgi:site-specific recombinase XerD